MADPKSQGGQKRRRQAKTEGTNDRWSTIGTAKRGIGFADQQESVDVDAAQKAALRAEEKRNRR